MAALAVPSTCAPRCVAARSSSGRRGSSCKLGARARGCAKVCARARRGARDALIELAHRAGGVSRARLGRSRRLRRRRVVALARSRAPQGDARAHRHTGRHRAGDVLHGAAIDHRRQIVILLRRDDDPWISRARFLSECAYLSCINGHRHNCVQSRLRRGWRARGNLSVARPSGQQRCGSVSAMRGRRAGAAGMSTSDVARWARTERARALERACRRAHAHRARTGVRRAARKAGGARTRGAGVASSVAAARSLSRARPRARRAARRRPR
jgi:hypothetical protein